MPRRKILLDEIFDILEALTTLYVLAMFYWWFTDKDAFWKWLFYGIAFVVVIIIIAIWRRKTRFKNIMGWHSDRELIQSLRIMEPSEFEEYIANLFSKLNYKTRITGGAYDKGIDVIAEKEGVKHYIQCKKFITRKVTVHDIRDFYGALADNLSSSKGYFITTNKFTLEAEKFAEDKPIELIDGNKLLDYIRLAEKSGKYSDKKNLGEIAKNCPECGGRLIERDGKYGKFLGCSHYPKCQYTENIKE